MKAAFLLACLVTLPLHHLTLNSGFGFRVHPVTGQWAFHAGIDLRARNDTVFAIMDGIVQKAAYDDILGIYIRLNHGRIQSLYGHLSRIFVASADSVFAGQPIAITGATGRVTGAHLHFAISFDSRPVHPLKFLFKAIIESNNTENHE